MEMSPWRERVGDTITIPISKCVSWFNCCCPPLRTPVQSDYGDFFCCGWTLFGSNQFGYMIPGTVMCRNTLKHVSSPYTANIKHSHTLISGTGGLPLAVQRPPGQAGGHEGGPQPQRLRWRCGRGQKGTGPSLRGEEENTQDSCGEHRQHGATTASKVTKNGERRDDISHFNSDIERPSHVGEDPSMICLQYSLFGVITFGRGWRWADSQTWDVSHDFSFQAFKLREW